MVASVAERGLQIATFRFVEVRLMEILAAWTPTTPEMEVKVMFGGHLWLHAQHADALGRRTFELRRPEQFSSRPIDAYVALLDDIATTVDTRERLSAFYDALLPGLAARYAAYRDGTDHLLDAPSVAIIDRIVPDLARERADADATRRQFAWTGADVGVLQARERALETLVAARRDETADA